MQNPTTSSERTPLVRPVPAYVYESSVTRHYQKRLRNFQCAICISLMVLIGVGLLVTIGYDLSNDMDFENSTTAVPEVEPRVANASRNLTAVSPELIPMLKLTWPLQGKPASPWPNSPTPEAITSAVTLGKAALRSKTDLEKTRRPLERDTPAGRAQRASATAATVKPMADAAYAAEMATKALVNGTTIPTREGGVGQGPATNGSFPEPRYCRAARAPPPCPPASSKYRSQDGSCNNLKNPLRWGVAHTPFRRVLPANYSDGVSAPRKSVDGSELPSARAVSVTVHRPSYAHDTAFTVMLAVWGQFIDHDITATAISKGGNSSSLTCCDASQPPHPECFPVMIDVEDPFYQRYNLTCMEFVRSAPAPTCHFGAREQMNQATAFLDGSTIYGYDSNRTRHLRAGGGGGGGGRLRMLQVGARELLPQSRDPEDGCNTAEMNAKGRYCFESGDDRANENLHLTTMHLIWARQHNRLAAMLQEINPGWSDETLFQEARRIVGAQMQHITYNEFLPAVLGADVMWALNLTLKDDGFSDTYNPDVDPSIANHFSASAFRFAHTLLPGLIHAAELSNGSVDYIHLHSMLFNPYALYAADGAARAVHSALSTPVHNVEPHVTSELGNHLFERPNAVNSSKKGAPCGLDLVSLNIQRGRDHGLPAYPFWREHCGFPRPKSFEELDGVFDDLSMARISTIYTSVDDIDLYTGALAEQPGGRLLGPTLTCLVADQFLRLKVADRFWYETGDRTVGFTLEQLTQLRATTLAGVICANEGGLPAAPRRAMQAIGGNNPLLACRALPQPDLAPWKEAKGNT